MCAIFEFSDFAQKSWKKIRFKFEISEKFYKGFPLKKIFPRESFVKWTHIKIKGNSFVKFSSLGLFAIFGFSDFAQKMWKKIRFKFENRENFYKGFPCKNFFPWESFVKWTHFKIERNSFVKFSAGGPRSIYKGIPLLNLIGNFLQRISL